MARGYDRYGRTPAGYSNAGNIGKTDWYGESAGSLGCGIIGSRNAAGPRARADAGRSESSAPARGHRERALTNSSGYFNLALNLLELTGGRLVTIRADGLETRRKLLDAAGVLFAQRGYHGTKTGDICRAAQVNIAAVHYHFRSKDEIYVAAWRHEFTQHCGLPAGWRSAGRCPGGGPAPRTHPGPGTAIHGSGQPRPGYRPSRDVQPTGLLAAIMHLALEPLRQMHLAIIRDILGPRDRPGRPVVRDEHSCPVRGIAHA